MFTSTKSFAAAAMGLLASGVVFGQVTISSVISVTQGPKTDLVTAVDLNRSNTANLTGTPENTDVQGPINFYSLGMGGEVVVQMSGPICNGPGNDLTVVETTWNLVCSNYPEKARVWASQDLCNWVELTSESNPICHNGDLDLGCLPWALYLKIKDVSPDNYTTDGDGYDIDGVTGNSAGCTLPTEAGLARYAANGFLGDPQATQGLTENNTAIPASRDNQARMLGLPLNVSNLYANDVTTSAANNNFFSLGKNGSVTLTFPYALFNGPGADVQIYETSFNDNAARTCSNYPEKATVEGSCDGVTFYPLTILPEDAGNGETAGSNTICRDGRVDFGSLPFVNYIRITDVTFGLVANFPGVGDGFDVDAVLGLQNCGGCARISEEGFAQNAEVMEDVLSMEVWPNPAHDFVSVSLLMHDAAQVVLSLTDLTGRVVRTKIVAADAVNMIQDFDLSGLREGIYMLQAEGNGSREVLRISKN